MKLKIKEHKFLNKTKKIIDIINEIINSYDLPWTVRQIHYNLVGNDIIINTLNKYKMVSRTLTNARCAGVVSWEKIIDDTRAAYKTTDYDSIENGIRSFLEDFRLSGRWSDSDRRIEVWVEKRALRRLLQPITDKYDVYLAVGGGWNSTSAIWNAVKRLTRYNTDRLDILYFGDLDPSGDDMPRDIEDRLQEFIGVRMIFNDDIARCFPGEIHVHKILLNEPDIKKYTLKKRFDVPVLKGDKLVNKIEEDPRARSFYDKHGELFQIEMEALPPNIIADVLENDLLKYVDEEKMEHIPKLEEKEIKRIKKILDIDGDD